MGNFLKWAIIICIAAISLFIIFITLQKPEYNIISLGSFIVLALTLIALIFYAFDTNTIARITKLKWEQESVLSATYTIEMYTGTVNSDKVLFRLTNPSKTFIKAKVNCNFKINGKSVNFSKPYSGEEIWILFPHQVSQGWFRISDILKLDNKTIENMKTEYQDNNRSTQLTMDLEIEFRDEFGQKRSLPKRRHFFEFKNWLWIPELTTNETWDD